MTFEEKLNHILIITGAVVPLLSAISSLINHIIRSTRAAGGEPGKGLLAAGSVLNIASVNLDKAVELAKMMRKPSAALPAATSPAAPAPVPADTKPPQG